MERIAFKMKMHRHRAAEYRQRHDVLWPELRTLLQAKGIKDYSIFLDENSGDLFGVLRIADTQLLNELANEPVMKKWWIFMQDIMETNADHSPLSVPLKEVFYLP